jgi:hypothetical protein
MSATTRSIQASPNVRPIVTAFAAILVAMGLALALAYSQLGAFRATTAPLSGSAQSAHDHGWSMAGAAPRNVAAQSAHDRGWVNAAGVAPVTHDRGLATAPSTNSTPAGGTGGGNGTRLAR